MRVPLDLRKIPSTRYVVYADNKMRYKQDTLNEEDEPKYRARRILRREWFDTNEEYLQYLMIIDALEI